MVTAFKNAGLDPQDQRQLELFVEQFNAAPGAGLQAAANRVAAQKQNNRSGFDTLDDYYRSQREQERPAHTTRPPISADQMSGTELLEQYYRSGEEK